MPRKAKPKMPANRDDFIRLNFADLSYREMAQALGISVSRVQQIALYKLQLGPKPARKPTLTHTCKKCGAQSVVHSRTAAERAYCADCKPARTHKGKRAYHIRHAMQKPWEEIARLVGCNKAIGCALLARRYAERNGLAWPVPKLTMADVLRLAESRQNQSPSPQGH